MLIQLPNQQIPFRMRKKVEAELQRLQELNITEDIKGLTLLVSPIVAAPKPGNPEQIKICANKAVGKLVVACRWLAVYSTEP